MKRYSSALLLLASAIATRAAAESRPVVAVFDVEVQRVKLQRDAIAALSDYLATQIAETGAYQIVPRDELKKRLSTQKEASYKSCYAESCQIEVGKELAAEKSVAARILKLGSSCKITVTLYDLRTSTSERAVTETGGCDEDAIVASLEKSVKDLVPKGAAQAVAQNDASVKPPAAAESKNPPKTIDGALQEHSEAATAPEKDELPEAPSKIAIVSEMAKLRAPVHGCYEQHKVPGLVKVQVVVAPSGAVAAASAQDNKANAPIGQCVAAAVLKARFAPSKKGVTFSYPFVMR
jgi:hypothetical protein